MSGQSLDRAIEACHGTPSELELRVRCGTQERFTHTVLINQGNDSIGLELDPISLSVADCLAAPKPLSLHVGTAERLGHHSGCR